MVFLFVKRALLFLLMLALSLSVLALPTSAQEQTAVPGTSIPETPEDDGESDMPDVSDVTGSNIVIFNMDTGVTIFDRNADEPVYLGFLPRLMTALVAFENIPDPDSRMVTITSEMLRLTPQVSSAGLSQGETLSVSDLIKCVLVGNSQEACVALAFEVAGNISGFLAMMNDKAEQLGAYDTRFSNVHGYYSPGDALSTVRDAAYIVRAFCEHEMLESWANLSYADLTVSGRTRRIYARNSIIVSSSEFYVRRAVGLAAYSGSGAPVSGANYIDDSNMRLLCIEASDGSVGDLYADMAVLLSFSAEKYITELIIKADAAVCEVPVEMGSDRDSVVAAAAQDIYVTHRDDYTVDDYEVVYDVVDSVTAPFDKGIELGSVSVYFGGELVGSSVLVAKTGAEVDRLDLFTQNLNNFFSNPILWIIIGVVVFLVLLYSILLYRASRRKAKRMKSAKHERIKMDIE